jgi:hypothetical protein
VNHERCQHPRAAKFLRVVNAGVSRISLVRAVDLHRDLLVDSFIEEDL